jgi:hypothetical protein
MEIWNKRPDAPELGAGAPDHLRDRAAEEIAAVHRRRRLKAGVLGNPADNPEGRPKRL